MIINILIFIVMTMLQSLFYILPVATIADIPYIGIELSSILGTIGTTWNAFMITFPYAVVGWNILIWVILPFEIAMLFAKIILGSRVPTHNQV